MIDTQAVWPCYAAAIVPVTIVAVVFSLWSSRQRKRRKIMEDALWNAWFLLAEQNAEVRHVKIRRVLADALCQLSGGKPTISS